MTNSNIRPVPPLEWPRERVAAELVALRSAYGALPLSFSCNASGQVWHASGAGLHRGEREDLGQSFPLLAAIVAAALVDNSIGGRFEVRKNDARWARSDDMFLRWLS